MAAQFALRLPDEIVAELDWLVVRCDYANRTEAMRDAIVRLIRAERSRAIDDEYVDAYTRLPQSDDELVPLSAQHLGAAEDWSAL